MRINAPWYIVDFRFDAIEKLLNSDLDFTKGLKFEVSGSSYCGAYNSIVLKLAIYIEATTKLHDYSDISTIGIDETSIAHGHDYLTLFVDLKNRRTIYIV